MKTFNWSWTSFVVGLSVTKFPNMKFENVWITAIHLGFLCIIICPGWDPDGCLVDPRQVKRGMKFPRLNDNNALWFYAFHTVMVGFWCLLLVNQICPWWVACLALTFHGGWLVIIIAFMLSQFV